MKFDAPMMSFGKEVIDNMGVVQDFPARSMICGLLGNALGYDRTDHEALDGLQERIDYLAVRAREGKRGREYQTARIFEKDAGWTTRGAPEGRGSSPSFSWDKQYEQERGVARKSLTHQRFRDFDADAYIAVLVWLSESPVGPDVDALHEALMRPERPLFLGRKSHTPSGYISRGVVEGEDALEVASEAFVGVAADGVRLQWSVEMGQEPEVGAVISSGLFNVRVVGVRKVSDRRNHKSGVHSGKSLVAEGLFENKECLEEIQ